MKLLVLNPAACLVLALAACQPVYSPGQTVTLAGGERCTVLGPDPQGTRLDCPTRGVIIAQIQQPDLGFELSDIPGVPDIPSIPRTQAEAECRAGAYVQAQVQGRIRGAAEGAVLNAAGLPGNTLGIWRRSQEIARRIEGRPAAPTPPDPCEGL
ncbi:MAG: hypothetical protein JKY00_07445 [Roseicyclus sp.]|nr:hypothetical protein [Roseicyclus sp.]